MWISVSLTVIAAFGAGAFGALLTSWNDRQERFRDRMLDAADEFAAAIAEALLVLRDAVGEVRGGDAVRAKAAAQKAWSQRDTPLIRSARVDLLFGPDSDTARCSNALLHHIAAALEDLNPPKLDAEAADQALLDAPEGLRMFQRLAFQDIRSAAPPSATLRESLRKTRRGSHASSQSDARPAE